MADENDFEAGDWELSGYEVFGEWRDIEKGDAPPMEWEQADITLVTVNLDPDSEEGFYRSYVVEGFDDDYSIEDLIIEAKVSYGLSVE